MMSPLINVADVDKAFHLVPCNHLVKSNVQSTEYSAVFSGYTMH